MEISIKNTFCRQLFNNNILTRSNLNVIHIKPIQFENAFTHIPTERKVQMPLKILQLAMNMFTLGLTIED